MNMRIPVFVAAACLAAGTIAFAQNVTYDVDRSADFSRFKTYEWGHGLRVGDELNDKRIISAIESQLASRGITRSEAGTSADLVVAYYATFDQALEINGSGWGGYRLSGMRSASARVDEVLLGTLAVQIVNAKTGAMVWRSMATKEIDLKASPEKRDKNIRGAIEKIFKHYPRKQ
jgi:hypothetical protein